MRLRLIGLAYILTLFSLSCGGGDDSGSGASYQGGMTQSAMGALPLFSALEVLNRPGIRTAAGDAINDDYLKNFFKLECHMPDQQNDCPDTIVADDSTKYTVTTLIGLIHHAEMKMKDIFRDGYTTCTVGEGAGPIAISSASFVSNDGGNGSKYVIDNFGLYECVGHRTDPAAAYFTYATAADKLIMVNTRKHDLYTEGWDQTDIWQVHLSFDAEGAEHLLAFNSVNINDAANDYTARAVLLVNLQTRKFLVKYGSHSYVVAAGRGGISAAGVFEEGSYFAKSSQTPAGVCIDNAARTESDAANCAAETAAWAGAADVATYLGMTDAEAADLAGFTAYFIAGATAEPLPAGAAPTSVADVVDMPDLIE